eukprot:gene29426-36647_t
MTSDSGTSVPHAAVAEISKDQIKLHSNHLAEPSDDVPSDDMTIYNDDILKAKSSRRRRHQTAIGRIANELRISFTSLQFRDPRSNHSGGRTSNRTFWTVLNCWIKSMLPDQKLESYGISSDWIANIIEGLVCTALLMASTVIVLVTVLHELMENRLMRTLVLNRPRHNVNWDHVNPYPLPDSIDKLHRLQTLSLFGQGYSSLPAGDIGAESFVDIHEMRACLRGSVSCGPASVAFVTPTASTVPGDALGVSQLKALRSIILGSSFFTQVPDQLQELKTLQRIALNYNALTSLPEWLLKLDHLESFMVSQGNITKLPEWVSRWPIKQLMFLNMNLVTVPDSIGDGSLADTCQYLWLGLNQIS